MRLTAVVLALIACVSLDTLAGQSETSAFTLSVSPQTLQPGGVILLTITSSASAPSEARAFGRPIRLWPGANPREWHGLVAADLEAKPGPYDIDVRATSPQGPVTAKLAVTIEPKKFETRRLKVDPGFVNPPASEGERIVREQKHLAAVFAQTSERIWRGPWVVPVPGDSTSSFGRLSVLNGERRGRHQGADFRAATGTPVHAPNAGRIAIAEDLYFSGNTVVIDHGLGMFSLIAHLSRIGVKVGDVVGRGDLLGDSGATGRVTGPHLHWALRIGPLSVDPLALIAALSDLQESSDPPRPR